MTPRRVLGVFAHPDDEVFCAGGAFALWAAHGADITIMSATRGEAGQIRDASLAVRSTLGQVREAELRRSCEILGVAAVRTLDYHDGTLRDVEPDELVAHVVGLIESLRPDVVVTFGEDGAYGHPDHVAIAIATGVAVERTRAAGVEVETLLRSHFPRSRLSLADRLARWLVEMEERFGGSSDYGRALTLFAHETSTMRFATDDVRVAWYPPGSMIVEQGEPATSLYLILSGEVEVFEERDGARHPLRTMHEGQFFGELGVVSGATRTASVAALGNVTCLALSPERQTNYAGRGERAVLVGGDDAGSGGAPDLVPDDVVRIDVSSVVDAKLAALASHRTQYPIDVELFPKAMLVDMFGVEYFVPS